MGLDTSLQLSTRLSITETHYSISNLIPKAEKLQPNEKEFIYSLFIVRGLRAKTVELLDI